MRDSTLRAGRGRHRLAAEMPQPGPRTLVWWRRAAPAVLLAAVCFGLWWLGAALRGGRSLFEHAVIDQHTLQALAWLEGRADLGRRPRYLEVAEFGGRYYVSFPPTPTLVELPLAAVFGRDTPNSLALFGFVLAGCL